eukprot:Hpha_TRINITY_DN9221_c0_g2::TRINITY_DN9221_c0_g2_i1::g.28544::m.28544
MPPQMLVCYLCGQQFGSASLPIHQPQCYQKQIGWWQHADPSTRGPMPKDPASQPQKPPGGMGAGGVQRFNEQQFADFNSNMAKCQNCGRTFLPDRLAVHLRSCNPSASGGGSKPPAGSGVAAVRRGSSPCEGGGDGSPRRGSSPRAKGRA